MSNKRGGMSIERLKELVRERSKRAELALDERRKIMDGNAEMFPVPEGVAIERADLGGLGAEWAIPAGAEEGPVVLYFHGGGYLVGSSVSHRHVTSRLAAASKGRVLSVDYALAPEHPFPAAVNDGLKAYRWLLDKGHAPERISIGGDSAGGGLTVATLLAAREAGLPMPASAVLISPWTDLTCATESYNSCADLDPMIQGAGIRETAAAYLNGADPRDPLASPNFADLTGLPPMLIHVGTDEVLLDDSRDLAKRAKAAGVEAELEVWEGMIHVWHAFYQMLPEGEQALDRLGAYLSGRWKAKERLAVPAG
ncbi:Alpha/beta hydrolase fold-3 domain protein [Parvibaculum lavamentivorans DS-1]|uniref:Alpha/beta hydrolase fold-3 domain protein n=1 Tax=Parvibaculum lavamentivorans (strain DS-1 / DSM 13023 / NCIMB 13966) TaxID=402881 RepID=A7HRG0_PARL1|nr:alpha/beta hydrolase [Parvibaculum lavamentivorans]ABS62493.1 Alpha/beta hydrolase fold-3 domain protein [Parvibaculum lavamentivorans DS-1]